MPPSSSPASRRRMAAALVAATLATCGLALAERGVRALAARAFSPTGGAEWIGSGDAKRERSPAAFYLARDFEVDPVPASVRLLALADPEYVLWVNGRRVGSGAWRPGDLLDAYEVGPLLQPGWNRVMAEVRSDHGAAGFLASLEDGRTGRQLLATDGRWRLFRREHPGLVRGWLLLAGGAPAYSWSHPPVGRWGMPRPGPEQPSFAALAGPPERARAFVRAAGPEAGPARVGFDFGREVTGYLAIEVAPAEATRVGLLYTRGLPAAPLDAWDAEVIVMPGRREWLDASPRRFRAVEVVGLAGATGARVVPVREPVPPAVAGRIAEEARPVRGVLGLAPPPLRTPVEDEVWRELQRVPGVAGRKEL